MQQVKEIGHSLFYTFQLQGSGDFDCEQKQCHLFPIAFQTNIFVRIHNSQATLA